MQDSKHSVEVGHHIAVQLYLLVVSAEPSCYANINQGRREFESDTCVASACCTTLQQSTGKKCDSISEIATVSADHRDTVVQFLSRQGQRKADAPVLFAPAQF